MNNKLLQLIFGYWLGLLINISHGATINKDVNLKAQSYFDQPIQENLILAQNDSINTNAKKKILKDLGVQVVTSLSGWIDAWEDHDLEKYFSFYSQNFEPAKNRSIKSWKKHRKPRIVNKKKIDIKLFDLNINFLNNTTTEVTFNQVYKSGNKRFKTKKKLLMVFEEGIWKIKKENTI